MMRFVTLLGSAVMVTACQSAEPARSNPTFDGIAAGDTVRFTGTEPFWGGEVAQGMARYTTPDVPDGTRFAVERFAGLNGVSFSGKVEGTGFDLMVTPGACSDGMSDRRYPFTATLRIGTETREGCAWTDATPHTEGTER
jgi:uncharacterized membrane protein